jgi:hypothetical protein
MRLLSLKALLPVVAFTMACHETMMMPLVVSRSFGLESVDNQPVPAVIFASGGDTTTLYWASLTLYEGGTADIATRTRQVHLTLPPREASDVSHFSYRVVGDDIVFDYSCPPNALCAMPPSGKITSSSTVTIFYGDLGRAVMYHYRLLIAVD